MAAAPKTMSTAPEMNPPICQTLLPLIDPTSGLRCSRRRSLTRFAKRLLPLANVGSAWPFASCQAQCVECGRVSGKDERGWAARLTYDDEVVVYGPECNQ